MIAYKSKCHYCETLIFIEKTGESSYAATCPVCDDHANLEDIKEVTINER